MNIEIVQDDITLPYEIFEVLEPDESRLAADTAAYVHELCADAGFYVNSLHLPVTPMARPVIILHGVGDTNFSQVLVLP